MSIILRYFLVFMISFSINAKCLKWNAKERYELSENIIIGEIVSSNCSSKSFFGILKKKCNENMYKATVKPLAILKGSLGRNKFYISYKWENTKPSMQVFQKGKRYILFIKKVEEENLILVGNRCEYGGIEYTGTSKEIDLLDKI